MKRNPRQVNLVQRSWRGTFAETLLERRLLTLRRKRVRHIQLLEDFICDLTSFPGLSSPTMSFPTTPLSGGSSPNCKDKTRWFLSSAAEVSAPKTAGRLKGLLNSIVSSRLAIAGLSQSAPTISLRRMNIAVELMPIGLSSPTRGVLSKKISTLPHTLILSTIR